MAEAFVSAQDLRKTYVMGRSNVHALAGLSVEIERGGFVAVLGPSGSGKSTLLHMVGGLDRPTQGTIRVGGKRLDEMDEDSLARYRRNHAGFIFQSFNLIRSMSALDNVALPLRFAGVNGRGRKERALELLNRVDLADRAAHRPSELSGGQQQRVAIARALANDPEIILADEPTGNLDSKTGLRIMQLLAELNSAGKTILVVSHDPRATHFASQIVRLLDGRSVGEAEYTAALAMAAEETER